MAEKWRRCDTCRKVKPIEDFDGAQPSCTLCLTPSVSGTKARASSRGSTVTTRTVAPAAQPGTPASAVPGLRGRGDPEVRARRARVRALDRLAEEYADHFEQLLSEERRA